MARGAMGCDPASHELHEIGSRIKKLSFSDMMILSVIILDKWPSIDDTPLSFSTELLRLAKILETA
jgi:hypothetical protein